MNAVLAVLARWLFFVVVVSIWIDARPRPWRRCFFAIYYSPVVVGMVVFSAIPFLVEYSSLRGAGWGAVFFLSLLYLLWASWGHDTGAKQYYGWQGGGTLQGPPM